MNSSLTGHVECLKSLFIRLLQHPGFSSQPYRESLMHAHQEYCPFLVYEFYSELVSICSLLTFP